MGLSVEYQHVQADKRTGRLSYRRVYPPELRPFILGNPTELKRSLAGTDLSNPATVARYSEAARLWFDTVEKAEKLATQRYDKPTPAQIARLAHIFEADWHQSEEANLTTGGGEYADQVLAGWEELLSDFKRWKIDRDHEAVVEKWGSSARALFETSGIMIAPDDIHSVEALSFALNDKAIALHPDSVRRMKGDVVAVPVIPESPSEPASAPSVPRARNGQSFEQIAQAILDSPAHNLGASLKQASNTALRSFRDAFGLLAPNQITKAMVTDWIALLFQRPSKLPATQRTMPLRDVVALYEGQKDPPRLTVKTVRTLLGMLCSLWNKAQEDGKIEENIPNPFAARKSLANYRARDHIELSTDELNAIFRLPVFSIGERPTRGKGEAAYWIPLLLLWTGARPEEIAQLMVSDIFRDPDDPKGRWLLRITDEGMHPYKGRRSLKTTQRKTGRRTFPIPLPIIDLNFIAYVDHVRSLGETALFPALRTKGARLHLFPGWGEWWSNYLKEKNVLPTGAKRRAAREFRHVWTTAARRSKVPEEAQEYIQGHHSGGKSANVLYGSLRPLGDRIDEIRFDGLDLSHVKPWRPNG